jgi:hypothetical protein
MIDFSPAAYAALPQNSQQHLLDLFQADRTVLNESDHHAHMLDQLRIFGRRQRLSHFGGAWSLLCLMRRFNLLTDQDRRFIRARLILITLEDPSLLSAIKLGATPNRFSAPVLLFAAKRTAQVVPPGIAGMSEKKDAAMPATTQAFAQMRLGSQSRSQKRVILQRQPGDRSLSIPSRDKLEKLRDPDCKKPKLSLKMLT